VFVSPNSRHSRQLCFTFALSLLHTQIHTSGGANFWSGRGSPYPALFAPLLFALRRGSTPPQCPITASSVSHSAM
jgi:hypothetical protein